MNLKFSGIIAGAALVALSSCSSVYKSGQTPDDVYYSPGKPAAAVAKTDQYLETNPRRNSYNVYDQSNYRDDQYMRLMIGAGRMPMYYNDFAMVDPWMYNNWRWNSYMTWNSGFNSPWNSMWYWNSFYNPYCTPIYVYPVKGGYTGNYGYPVSRPSRPVSAFSMGSYLNTNNINNRSGYKPGKAYTSSYNTSNGSGNYNNTNTRRSLFDGGNNNGNSSYERPSRSYTPSGNSGSSGSRSSSGSSGGSVSRPTRTGGN